MQSRGWVPYDLTDQAYYPSDSTMFQLYVTFIPRSMDTRSSIAWCLPEQEAQVMDGLRERRRNTIELLERYARDE